MNLAIDKWNIIKETLTNYYVCSTVFELNPIFPQLEVLSKAFQVLIGKYSLEFDFDDESYDDLFTSMYPEARQIFTKVIRSNCAWIMQKNSEVGLIREAFQFMSVLFFKDLNRTEEQNIQQIALDALRTFDTGKNDEIFKAINFFLQ